MTDVVRPRHEHELRLRRGESTTLRFRFAASTGRSETTIALLDVDAVAGRIELSLESFWSAYEMMLKQPNGRWSAIRRPSDCALPAGRVPVSLDVGAGAIFGIYPQGLMGHTLELVGASFVGDDVVLRIAERG